MIEPMRLRSIKLKRPKGLACRPQVWGEMADEASLTLARELVRLPIQKGMPPGSMRMLAEPIAFTVHPV